MNTKLILSLVVAAIALAATVEPLRAATFLRNPSFESNYNDAFPHYGAIDEWTGGSGVNEADGPFHNGGTPIPDQNRAAFMQGSATLAQEISGLTPGQQYWIQFHYDARGCCGGTIDLITKFNDVQLDSIVNVRAVTGGLPYYFRNVIFTPDGETGTLAFSTVASGDATVNLDAVTIVARDDKNVPVANPSFEASGTVPDIGMVSPANVAGWTGVGGYGINVAGAGPFADNGAAPDQDNVAFVQGVGSLSQVVPNLSVGKPYQLTFGYNARSGNSPHLQVKVGDAVLLDEDVTPVGGANAYRTKSVNFTASDIFAQITFSQTKDGDHTVLLDDIRLSGEIVVPPPPIEFAPTKAELAPGQKVAVSVTVPAIVLEAKAVTLKFRSPNPAVVILTGADPDGLVTLQYDKGGANVKNFEVEAVARGVARIEAVELAGLTVVNDVSVNVVTSFVRNPSFESSPAPGGVGYGAMLAWTGGSGLNKAAGPFHDNGLIPDREQIAFLQGSPTMWQAISGLTPGKNYWLQFRYNVRNCCAGGTMDLSVKFDGKELFTRGNIAAVGEQNPYYETSIEFKPASSAGVLEFIAKATGDATLLLDGVTIVQRDAGQVLIQNPSFEASGSPVGVGYIQPNRISGWDMTGGYGVNITGVGPFTDNGAAPDQDLVLFLQGAASASQNIAGLTAGAKYTLIYSVNARNCCGAGVTRYNVSLADETLLEEEIVAVGGTNPYDTKYVVFTANVTEGLLRFQGMPEGDHTLLLDNVKIVTGEVGPPPPDVSLQAAKADNNTLRIAWPSTAVGFVLQVADSVAGLWKDAGLPATVEGNDQVVTAPIEGAMKFYRLIQ